ncbi:hypothetical protein [Nocardia sp. NPDC050710]|uniref:hypothetical protein n=1 Tax=Nocardia sp. NPDC050710 TaxID=3157220 RepID=UPI0034099BC0
MPMLNTVGIYREMYRNPKAHLPSLREARATQPLTDRQEILRYMRSATPVFDVLEDVVDLVNNTTVIPSGPSLISDGVWIWRVDSIHYLANYHFDFPEAFLFHVRNVGYRPPTSLPSTDEFDAEVMSYF